MVSILHSRGEGPAWKLVEGRRGSVGLADDLVLRHERQESLGFLEHVRVHLNLVHGDLGFVSPRRQQIRIWNGGTDLVFRDGERTLKVRNTVVGDSDRARQPGVLECLERLPRLLVRRESVRPELERPVDEQQVYVADLQLCELALEVLRNLSVLESRRDFGTNEELVPGDARFYNGDTGGRLVHVALRRVDVSEPCE